jgi:DsbC/DsbD-like thiol-disulfide interchange protein
MIRQLMAASFPSFLSATAHATRRHRRASAFATALLGLSCLLPCETRARIAGMGVAGLEEDLVTARLVCDAAAIEPGGTFRIAVLLEPAAGWHVNWLNPGDAGLAPGIAWRAPEGFKVGPVCWPLPERFKTGPLVIFGYARELLLAAEVRVPADAKPGSTVEFGADVSWLACNEACIPGSATVTLRIPVRKTAATDAEWMPRIERSVARCPRPTLEWNVEAKIDPQGFIAINVGGGADAVKLDEVLFFPYQPGLIENAAPQRLVAMESMYGRVAYQLRVEISRMAAGLPSRLSGILVSRSGWSDGDKEGAIEFDVPLGRR